MRVPYYVWWIKILHDRILITKTKRINSLGKFVVNSRFSLRSKFHFRMFRDSNLVDSASSIRLSQRLSHACLSINDFILWNWELLIISVIVYLMVLATWITVVILELIHASNPNLRRGVFIRWKPMQGNLEYGDS